MRYGVVYRVQTAIRDITSCFEPHSQIEWKCETGRGGLKTGVIGKTSFSGREKREPIMVIEGGRTDGPKVMWGGGYTAIKIVWFTSFLASNGARFFFLNADQRKKAVIATRGCTRSSLRIRGKKIESWLDFDRLSSKKVKIGQRLTISAIGESRKR